MTRIPIGLTLAASCTLAMPSVAGAQIAIEVGGGGTFPTGGYARQAETGWMLHAGVAHHLSEMPITVGALGFFGSNGHDVPNGDRTDLFGGVANASYELGAAERFSPYVGGMIGVMTRAFKSESQPGLEDSKSGLTVGPFVGVAFPLADVGGYVEGWWLTGFGGVHGTHLGGAGAGVAFPLGGGGM
jgi:hypothetical protein